jgi:hypothetical protein
MSEQPAGPLLLANARVHGRPQDAPGEAVLLAGGRIAAAGALEDVRAQAPAGVRELDAGGRRVVPAWSGSARSTGAASSRSLPRSSCSRRAHGRSVRASGSR